MFYRRKILLALIEAFGGELEKIQLQKLLFLFNQQTNQSIYEFIPHKYGCFSFTSHMDLGVLERKGMLYETANAYQQVTAQNYISLLKPADRTALLALKTQFLEMDSNDLTRFTYINFPYTAIKSTIASKILTSAALEKVKAHQPHSTQKILFTIGYEGNSLENYLNRLIKNDVKALIDVRNNPLSMKFGFSKSQLKRYCEQLGISYYHFPELGIQSEARQALNTQSDYNNLFADYRAHNLPKTQDSQAQIADLLNQYERIALTCFEANICQCHRKDLSETIKEKYNFALTHI